MLTLTSPDAGDDEVVFGVPQSLFTLDFRINCPTMMIMIQESPSLRGTKPLAANGENLSRKKFLLEQGDLLNGGRRTKQRGRFQATQ